MAKQVQLRRGTTAELSSVTGAIGEVIVDTTKDTLTVHDGYTAGGTPLLKEDLGNLANNSIGLGKIATGTHGQVLYYNASGQLTTLSPGTAGHVLKTNGAGQNPSWAEGLPSQTGNAGKYLRTDGTTASWVFGSAVRYVHHFEDATRNISLSTSSDAVYISFDINKVYSDTTLILIGRTPIAGSYSYQTGEYITVSGTRKYEVAHFVGAIDADHDGRYGTIFWQGSFTGKGTGTHTIGLGWAARNGSSGERPGDYWNPENLSARTRARTTQITIFEVDASSNNSTIIT